MHIAGEKLGHKLVDPCAGADLLSDEDLTRVLIVHEWNPWPQFSRSHSNMSKETSHWRLTSILGRGLFFQA